MAKHEVTLKSISMTLGKKSYANFEIIANGELLGVLSVGNAGLDWRPRGKQKKCFVKWEGFDKFNREQFGY